jgi:hypothetical protein
LSRIAWINTSENPVQSYGDDSRRRRKMRQTRRFFAYTAALPLFATFLWMAIPGCSGENTLVAKGDPVARRKQKEEALNKMLNPTGVPAQAAKAKGKGKSRSGASKEGAVDEMYLP